ncbi:hypothetical protein [Mycolicibacterium tusciae]|uniref:hypothetical protein n=1 Tax=Mycolicibacterium tusciae TaxID=75922 RepID=UPI0002D64499|nr:hypothetical protein [Mycolicibacterium tusciae]
MSGSGEKDCEKAKLLTRTSVEFLFAAPYTQGSQDLHAQAVSGTRFIPIHAFHAADRTQAEISGNWSSTGSLTAPSFSWSMLHIRPGVSSL